MFIKHLQDTKDMSSKSEKTPSKNIAPKLIKYFVFTILMSWSPMGINFLICYLFNIEFKPFYLYTPEICFMNIILASTNIKDLLESNIPRDKAIFISHIICNIINIVLSLIFIGISSYIELSEINTEVPIIKQYHFIMAMYFMAAFLGSWVQIGGLMKWKE